MLYFSVFLLRMGWSELSKSVSAFILEDKGTTSIFSYPCRWVGAGNEGEGIQCCLHRKAEECLKQSLYQFLEHSMKINK